MNDFFILAPIENMADAKFKLFQKLLINSLQPLGILKSFNGHDVLQT